MFEHFFQWLRVRLGVHLLEDAIWFEGRRLAEKLDDLTPVEKPPLVHLIVIGADGTTFGTTARASPYGITRLEVLPARLIINASIVVLSDWEEMACRGIYVGNRMVSEGMPTVTTGAMVEVGVGVSVMLERVN